MATFCQLQNAGLFINQSHSFLSTKTVCKSKTFQFINTTSSSPTHFQRSRKSSISNSRSHTAKCSMQSSPRSPTTTDLRLTIQRCSTVVPWKETERRTMFLSDLEQYLNFNLGTISFFTANAFFSQEMVVEKLQTAFRKALLYYDYLAGRLRFNVEEGRLEIDCNSAGAGFVVVSSELSLGELGDLVNVSPAFQELETMRPEKCLFVMQVVLFKCGGFAITACMNHVTLDGWSLKMFFNNLTSLLARDSLLFMPCNDRQLLSVQPPKHLTFPHLQGINLEVTPKGPESELTSFQVKSLKPQSKVFRISPGDIMKLKLKAKANTGGGAGEGISRFKVITAHLWRCKGLARNPGNDPDKKSTIHFPVDMRSRLHQPPLPPSFTGNATIDSPWTTTCHELEHGPFSQLVEMVSKAISKITEEHIRSVVESGEWLTGFPYGDVIVTPWMHLGYNDVEYPWGKPECTCPLVISDWNDIIILFPEENSYGANIVVTLPHEEMERFEALFYNM